MHTDPHDRPRDSASSLKPAPEPSPENPGYETADVNVGGVAVFLAGLFGTLIVFFFVCFGMGRVINNLFEKQDGGASHWRLAGNGVPPQNGRRRDLTSNAALEQEQLRAITGTFPAPRLEADDSAQQTADLHAREDLLLEHYSRTTDGQPVVRIPIERAMELIVQRGLPVAAQPAGAPDQVAYAATPPVQEPLTKGFARTGFELETIEAREQKMDFGRAEHTSLMQTGTQPK